MWLVTYRTTACSVHTVQASSHARDPASQRRGLLTRGFFRLRKHRVAEASPVVPRRAYESWPVVLTSIHSPGKGLPLLATMDRATLLRAATAYLHARDVRALRITAPAAQSNAIGVPSE